MNHSEILEALAQMHDIVQENLCYGLCDNCALWKNGVCRASIINKAITELEIELRQERGNT